MLNDLISRQAAIDALDGKFNITGRENAETIRDYINGVSKKLRELPSAQPEITRCKDCKYYSYGTIEGKHLCMSVKYRFTPTAEDEWCSRAERKEE